MDRLAELRERRALTLRELSDMSGVAADTINQIELGHRKPRPSTLRKLARAFGIDVEEFYAEPALPKAKAPDLGPSKKETEEDVRLRVLGRVEQSALNINRECRNSLEAMDITTKLDTIQPLLDLIAKAQWCYQGATDFIKSQEQIRDAEMGSRAERRAWISAITAINKLLDTAEDVGSFIDRRTERAEEAETVASLEEYRRKLRSAV
jgi:transcriptional regulator with XRE-family HTH domain